MWVRLLPPAPNRSPMSRWTDPVIPSAQSVCSSPARYLLWLKRLQERRVDCTWSAPSPSSGVRSSTTMEHYPTDSFNLSLFSPWVWGLCVCVCAQQVTTLPHWSSAVAVVFSPLLCLWERLWVLKKVGRKHAHTACWCVCWVWGHEPGLTSSCVGRVGGESEGWALRTVSSLRFPPLLCFCSAERWLVELIGFEHAVWSGWSLGAFADCGDGDKAAPILALLHSFGKGVGVGVKLMAYRPSQPLIRAFLSFVSN